MIAAILMAAQAVAAAPAAAPAAVPPADESTKVSLGARFDCSHNFDLDKGDTQNCIGISGLRLGLTHQAAANVRARLRLDPFATPKLSAVDFPLRDGLPTSQDTSLGIIDDYGVTWSARPALEVAIEAYDGAAFYPSVSELSTANSLISLGWRQSAMTISYDLTVPVPLRVRFAAGDGEGAPTKSVHPQQFFGLDIGATVVRGVRANVGVSLDGNDVGSEEYQYIWKSYSTQCTNGTPGLPNAKLGHSTQRLAAGLMLDGTLPGAEGLKLALGWQRSVATDTDKTTRSAPGAADYDKFNCTIDPDTVFAEDPNGNSDNSVARTVYDVSLNYKLFGTYFAAADYTTRLLDTGSEKLFSTCGSFTGTACNAGSESATKSNRLTQNAFSVGGGTSLASGLVLTLEYFKSSYDEAYTRVYYVGEAGKATPTLEAFNARVAYAWK